MSDLVDMNLNNIPQFATDSGDANTGIYLDELLRTYVHDSFMVEMDDGQITAHGWDLPTLPSSPPTNHLGDSPGTPGTPATLNPMAGLSATPTPSDDQYLKSPQQQTEHALDPGSEPQTLRQQKCSCTQAPQKVKISRAKSYPCFIPGCTQRFKRSDYRGNHLRNKHDLPIEKGRWAKIWISKAENQEHYLAAANLQAYTNNLPS